MLDAGLAPIEPAPEDRPIELLRALARTPTDVGKLDRLLVGHAFESVLRPSEASLSIKLKPPYARYITERPRIMPRDEHIGCECTQSFAIGGLANAWGAGAMRYAQTELAHFPYAGPPLEEAFDALTAHIGISGSRSDDLASYFGSVRELLPELPLSELGQRFLDRYRRHRARFQAGGVSAGRPRLAVLPVDHGGRRAFKAFGQEFFVAPHEGIYSPAFTIRGLVQSSQLEYQSGVLIERFECHAGEVRLEGRRLPGGEPEVWVAEEVVLAAGTINTSRIVLASRRDCDSRLPLLENPVSFVPFVDVARIGVPLAVDSFTGAELSLVIESDEGQLPVQASIYNLMGPLRTDMSSQFPLTWSGNLAAGRYLMPATLVAQLFYPDSPSPSSYIQLLPTGGLRIVRSAVSRRGVEGKLVSLLRRVGYAALVRLVRHAPAGSSIHYAGTIPARTMPRGPYETDSDCRLLWAPRVIVADASTFPVLPAKNHTLMLMANAYRIAHAMSAR